MAGSGDVMCCGEEAVRAVKRSCFTSLRGVSGSAEMRTVVRWYLRRRVWCEGVGSVYLGGWGRWLAFGGGERTRGGRYHCGDDLSE